MMKYTTVLLGILLIMMFYYGCDLTIQLHIEGGKPSTTTFEKNMVVVWSLAVALVFYVLPDKLQRRISIWLRKKLRGKIRAVREAFIRWKASRKQSRKTLAERIEEESRGSEG
jgi:hypothetical protein